MNRAEKLSTSIVCCRRCTSEVDVVAAKHLLRMSRKLGFRGEARAANEIRGYRLPSSLAAFLLSAECKTSNASPPCVPPVA
jgi:hypothetical protein